MSHRCVSATQVLLPFAERVGCGVAIGWVGDRISILLKTAGAEEGSHIQRDLEAAGSRTEMKSTLNGPVIAIPHYIGPWHAPAEALTPEVKFSPGQAMIWASTLLKDPGYEV